VAPRDSRARAGDRDRADGRLGEACARARGRLGAADRPGRGADG
jgi:hypothetical protein